MTKKKHSADKGTSRSRRPVVFFHWEKDKEFTVLEEFVLRAIETQRSLDPQELLPDLKIADILCLEEKDIFIIIEHIKTKYPGDIQGDPSHRSLREGFSRKLPDCFAVAIANKSTYPIGDFSDSSEIFADFLAQSQDNQDNTAKPKLAEKREEFRREREAKAYHTVISYNLDRESPDFHCGDIPVPEVAHPYLTTLLIPKS